MKKVIAILPAVILLFTFCSKSGIEPQNGSLTNARQTTPNATTSGQQTSKVAGNKSNMPAYYDSMKVTIQFVEFSPMAEANLIAHNGSLNFIYQSDPGLPNNQPFISVIDAIQGDGFNPVWREVQIAFNPGFTPRQLFSDNEVLAAASGPNPEITLDTTNEVYWCPVVGRK